MRKIIAILVAMAMTCVFAPMVGAGSTDSIIVTLNPQGIISIIVDQSAWNPGCTIGGTNATATTWANIRNDGNVNVNVSVYATNTSVWTLGATAGHNQFSMNITGTSAKALTYTATAWLSNLPDAGDPGINFGLQVAMPTSSSTNAAQVSTITFTATAT